MILAIKTRVGSLVVDFSRSPCRTGLAVHLGPLETCPRCGGHAWHLNSTCSCILEGLGAGGTRVRH